MSHFLCFLITYHVRDSALRAMISQYVLFMGIATVCFTGLLYTLWFLGIPRFFHGNSCVLIVFRQTCVDGPDYLLAYAPNVVW